MSSTTEFMVTAIVCLISAMVIQRIFIKEKKRGTNQHAINGIKWFGLAIFVWGFGALLNLVYTQIFQWSLSHKILIYSGVLVSLANSLFILLSLPSIEHNHRRGIVVRLIERFSTKEFIGLYSGVLGMITFVFIASSYNNATISNNFIWLIDIPISIFVALSLLYELNSAFKSRQMTFMYLPTFVLFLLIVIAVSHRIIPQDQVVQIIDQKFWAIVGGITAISFKFLFILLFSILLYSWKFLSEKEEQQSLVHELTMRNKKLNHQMEQLQLANESHLDTIKNMKKELLSLSQLHTIEFSERQKEVLGNLALFGHEKSYNDIAEMMHISVDGLQTHIHQIKKMLNIKGSEGKEQLIAYAITNDFAAHASRNMSD
ncbi:hypothetical protein ACU8DI_08800 [Psychroserpens sp. BH13MA-6]